MVVEEREVALDTAILKIKKQNKCISQTLELFHPYMKNTNSFSCEYIEKIVLCKYIYDKYASIFYNGNDERFNYLFRNFLK